MQQLPVSHSSGPQIEQAKQSPSQPDHGRLSRSGLSRLLGVGWSFGVMIILGDLGRCLAGVGDGHWDRQFGLPGTTNRVIAMRFNGETLYASGYAVSGGPIATNIGVDLWDGTNWSSIGDISGGLCEIVDLAFIGSNVYAGGIFDKAGGSNAVGLAKWDGAKWSAVGGFAGAVFAMTTDGTNLYVGGTFTNVGGVLNTNVAKWNGNAWSALGSGVGVYAYPSSYVTTLEWQNGQLYAGGVFTNAGSVAATNLAVWNGSAWSAIGGGANGLVATIQFFGSDMYIGGKFTSAGPVSALNIARWDGNAWFALGTGLKASPSVSAGTPVTAIAFLGTDLYACGNFTNAGGIKATRFAKWDGFSWSATGAGLNATGGRMAVHNDSLYVGGEFNVAGLTLANHIARWDGGDWHPLGQGQGTHTFVEALTAAPEGVYVGGYYSVIGPVQASRIARWDGSNWNTLDTGLSGSLDGSSPAVRDIKVRGGDVFVGGTFTSAGGISASNIAVWNGSSWSAMGAGVDSWVLALDVTPTDVYIGGSFTNVYDFPGFGFTGNRVARWDGANWQPMGSGVNGTVNTMVATNGVVYVGGQFTTAGGNAANRIAMWDGFNWSSFGSGVSNGVNGIVLALLVDGTDVYVGGNFSSAGNVSRPGLAKWNGTSWSSVGTGLLANGTPRVSALVKWGSWFYIGGTFTNASGVRVQNIVRWDGGTQWEALGTGIGGETSAPRVNGLDVWGDDLYVGGIFDSAGVSGAGNVARWNPQLDFTPPSLLRFSNAQWLSGSFKFRLTASERAAYVIQYSSNFSTWAPLTTNSAPQLDFTDSTVSGSKFRVYRAKEIP